MPSCCSPFTGNKLNLMKKHGACKITVTPSSKLHEILKDKKLVPKSDLIILLPTTVLGSLYCCTVVMTVARDLATMCC